MINTVLGKIKPSQLGHTLIHEHICCYNAAMEHSFGKLWVDKEALLQRAISMVSDAKKNGIDTIVDGTPINLGRSIELIKKISLETKVNIVVSSGFYYTDEPFLEKMDYKEIVKLLLYEIINGIENTKICPGILKVATGKTGITDINYKLLSAIAVVQNKTKLPLFVHSNPNMGTCTQQIKILEEYGANLNFVIMGHSGDTNDINYLKSLLEKGCYLGLDRFGVGESVNSFNNRIETLSCLKKEGWLNKLLISHDYSVFIDFGKKCFSTKEDSDINYTYISRKVIPALKEKGFSHEEIEKLLITNPMEILAGEEK